MEIVKKSSVYEYKTISGNTIAPFFTEDFEGIDVNNQIDWLVAETIIQNQLASYNDSRPKDFKLEVRIGVHIGDVVKKEEGEGAKGAKGSDSQNELTAVQEDNPP